MSEPAPTDDRIQIRGARVHNLRNIDLDIPRDRLVVITGVSGSGKSSLAFDTLFAEGQRRYLECLSARTRQHLTQLERPDVDSVSGLPPTICVDQQVGSARIRSTLATTTEIYDYLRLLYARAGQAHCPDCRVPVSRQSVATIVDRILAAGERRKIMLLAPLIVGRKGAHRDVFEKICKAGFVRARVDGELVDAGSPPDLPRSKSHTIEAVVDRIIVKPGIEDRLRESVELALKHGDGSCLVSELHEETWRDQLFSSRYCCPECGTSFPPLEPRTFSFNSPYGACPTCKGLGRQAPAELQSKRNRLRLELTHQPLCPDCLGARLAAVPRAVTFCGLSIHHLTAMPVGQATETVQSLLAGLSRTGGNSEEQRGMGTPARPVPGKKEPARVTAHEAEPGPAIADPAEETHSPEAIQAALSILPDVESRLTFLQQVGLDYLTLDRPAPTLSGGEFQRARLASSLGSGLTGICYILDEPTIGLHARDTRQMLDVLTDLRDKGSSVLVVEHDVDLMRSADWLVDLGPGAGSEGGSVTWSGSPAEIQGDSPTARVLQAEAAAPSETEPAIEPVPFIEKHAAGAASREPRRALRLEGARRHNLQNVSVDIPLEMLTTVTGVSGCGKSSLIVHTLIPALKHALKQRSPRRRRPDQSDSQSGDGDETPLTFDLTDLDIACDRISGVEHIDRLVVVDQSQIGRSGRSNPATHTGLWDEIRRVFAKTREARLRGFQPRRFSFNARDGRCPTCEGRGTQRVEMNFLPDVHIACPDCRGARFNPQTLSIRYRGKSVGDVLSMRIEQARDFFSSFRKLKSILDVLCEVGLGYLELGQSALTLSGGEAQRIKLAAELGRESEERLLFVLDEPTTGLHPFDVSRLLDVFRRLILEGHSVLVIEHDLDVIASSDWLIDLGPEGGASGGRVLTTGHPDAVSSDPAVSHTAAALHGHRHAIEM